MKGLDCASVKRPMSFVALLLCTVMLSACGSPSAPGEDSGASDAPRPLEDASVFQNHLSPFRTQQVEIVLAPGQGTEVKSVLAQDQVILYQWSAAGGFVHSDFHGHDPADTSFWVQYRLNDAGLGDFGSLVAPFDGQHGWYYRNDGTQPVVISLRVSGYFSEIVDFGIF